MVNTMLHRWVTPHRGHLGAGLVSWVICSIAAALYATQSGIAHLPTVVTWNEWLVAIILIPGLFRIGPLGAKAAVSWARWIAGTVLGLDLLVRAFFGLGWQPFL